jgi:RNA-directed DNA polymerase
VLYIERWLTAPMERDGELVARTRGTPQGGVISPILSNLFLHYAFDLWMKRAHPAAYPVVPGSSICSGWAGLMG